MKLVCPDCRSLLIPIAGDRFRCDADGGEFRLLYERPLPPEAPPVASAGQAPVPPATAAPPEGSPAPAPVAVPQHRCQRHPNVVAVARCAVCGAYSCGTCDFEFPGGIHLCPKCATEPQTNLSPKRKQLVFGSYATAAFATIGLAVLLSGALAPMLKDSAGREMVGMFVSIFLYAPALAGLAMSLAASERRLPNPPVLWGTVIWNILLVGVLALLAIVGLAK